MNVHVVKTVPIEFKQVVDAYQKVRQGGKATGIDGESWNDFDKKLQNNLYVIWNRLSSGSYFPSAVRETEIAKKDGSMRKLGIPTLRDRIAQEVVRKYMEQRIEPLFHDNSYGYRPLRSAKQAIDEVKKNCKTTDWVIDLDISKFFDEISHELMLKAVEHVIEDKWVSMYVRRWLEMKIVNKQGEETERGGKGTPQGGVISPLLANLYLHFSLDKWLEKNYSELSFVRYADDMVLHCRSREEAEALLVAIKQRLAYSRAEVK
jgi:RNA-directed DNA polymerase